MGNIYIYYIIFYFVQAFVGEVCIANIGTYPHLKRTCSVSITILPSLSRKIACGLFQKHILT